MKDRGSRSVDRTPQRADPLTIPAELAGEREKKHNAPAAIPGLSESGNPGWPDLTPLELLESAQSMDFQCNTSCTPGTGSVVHGQWSSWAGIGSFPVVTLESSILGIPQISPNQKRHGMCTVQSDNACLAYKKSDRDLRVNLDPEGHEGSGELIEE